MLFKAASLSISLSLADSMDAGSNNSRQGRVVVVVIIIIVIIIPVCRSAHWNPFSTIFPMLAPDRHYWPLSIKLIRRCGLHSGQRDCG